MTELTFIKKNSVSVSMTDKINKFPKV